MLKNHLKIDNVLNVISSQSAFFIIEKFLIALCALFKGAYSKEYIF